MHENHHVFKCTVPKKTQQGKKTSEPSLPAGRAEKCADFRGGQEAQLRRLTRARPGGRRHPRTHLLLALAPEAQTGGPLLVPVPVVRPGLVGLELHHFKGHKKFESTANSTTFQGDGRETQSPPPGNLGV